MLAGPLNLLTDELRRRVLESARQRSGRLTGLTVRVPRHINPRRQCEALQLALASEGLADVSVSVVCGPGPVDILALEFER